MNLVDRKNKQKVTKKKSKSYTIYIDVKNVSMNMKWLEMENLYVILKIVVSTNEMSLIRTAISISVSVVEFKCESESYAILC